MAQRIGIAYSNVEIRILLASALSCIVSYSDDVFLKQRQRLCTMEHNRRDWIKKVGLATMGLGLSRSTTTDRWAPPRLDEDTSASSAQKIERPIPRTGEMLPAVGVGSFETFDVAPGQPLAHVRDVVHHFATEGGTLIDTSPLYGMSETTIGHVSAAWDIGEDLFIATKTWATGRWLGDDSQALRQLETSMERLWRSRIDLLQVHSLINTPVILPLLRRWKEEGRVRYVGVTDWRPESYPMLERLLKTTDLDFLQVNYSIFSRLAEERLLPLAADTGTAVIVNMPFEKGRLFDVVQGHPLPDWASEIDCTYWSQFFLKFVLGHPAVTCVIPATSNPDHMRENMGALYGRLPEEALRREMVLYLERFEGFDQVLSRIPYQGKSYGGVVQFPLR